MLEIVLFRPEIPANTGNLMRLCVNAPARLHLIEPLGFHLDDRRVRRAGLDYRDLAQVTRHRSLDACLEALGPDRRWLAFSSFARRAYSDWAFEPQDVLLFGSETAGLPGEVLEGIPAERQLVIPQMPGARSLNLSNAVAVVVFEAWRQGGFAGAVSRSRA